jgi:hypothetical protein
LPKARASSCHCVVSRVTTAADWPAPVLKKLSSAGSKSFEDRPCRYSSGNTSVIFGDLRHQAGRIAEANRRRSPVGLVDSLVVDSRRDHLHRPNRGQHPPR